MCPFLRLVNIKSKLKSKTDRKTDKHKRDSGLCLSLLLFVRRYVVSIIFAFIKLVGIFALRKMYFLSYLQVNYV